MEYDPASPTDEPEEFLDAVDISAIPLPSYPSAAILKPVGSLSDIPLPPADLTSVDIPMPPVAEIEPKIAKSEILVIPNSIEPKENDDSLSAPLKFSIKTAGKQLPGQEGTSESGVFESSKDLKNDEPRLMPKLQAMMKRSKPSQLPVGVLPSKNKLPQSEVKTELFLPAKEGESAPMADVKQPVVTPSLLGTPSVLQSSLLTAPQIGNADTSGVFKENSAVDSLTNTSSFTASESNQLSRGTVQPTSTVGSFATSNSSSTNASVSSPHIPNLMSLNIQPIQQTLRNSAVPLVSDAAAILRQPKVSLANMQYVNPQKLRSAQMIATPLIANPALAAQPHHNDEQSKSRDNRRRSRSRSRRRSRSDHRRSPRRDSRRHRSSSSDDSSPRRSSRHHRRSRSRGNSRDRHFRDRGYNRDYVRERRDSDRHRDKRYSDSGRSSTKGKSIPERRSARYDSSNKDVKRSHRSRSPESHRSPANRSHQSKSNDSTGSSRRAHNTESREKEDRKGMDKKEHSTSHRDKNQGTGKKVSSSSRSERRSRSRDKTKHSSSNQRSSKKEVENNKGTLADLLQKHQKKEDGQSKTRHSTSDSGSENSNSSIPLPVPDSGSQPIGLVTEQVQSLTKDISASIPSSSSSEDSGTEQLDLDDNLTKLLVESDVREKISPPANDVKIGDWAAEKSEAVLDDFSSGNIQCEDMDLCSDSELDAALLEDVIDNFDASACGVETPNELANYFINQEDSESPIVPSDTEQSLTNLDTSEATLESAADDISPQKSLRVSPVQSCESESGHTSKYHLRKRRTRQSTTTCRLAKLFANVRQNQIGSVVPSESVFASFPDAPKPDYVHILDNDYTLIESSGSSVVAAHLLGSGGSSTLRSGMRRWTCDCTEPNVQELNLGYLSCGPGCINRALNIECETDCHAGVYCSNRRFQERLYAATEPFYSGPGKGWGLRAIHNIEACMFVHEYVGEVINFVQFRRRIRRYERDGHAHHYFMSLEPDRLIDAGSKGNWARFVNHSCEPNCETQKWSVNGRIRIGFFAKRDIDAGEEITIDYQFIQFGVNPQKCYCGTPSCTGVMGSTSKSFQDKVRLRDVSGVERRVMQLLQLDSFQCADDITLLLQVMVQECLTRYTRMELLQRLAATDAIACLKLFRQYNGLDMLAALMFDAAPTDWTLKRQILVCLEKIPVSEQKQVNSNSRIMDIVSQWSINPLYCRSRGCDNADQASRPVDSVNPVANNLGCNAIPSVDISVGPVTPLSDYAFNAQKAYFGPNSIVPIIDNEYCSSSPVSILSSVNTSFPNTPNLTSNSVAVPKEVRDVSTVSNSMNGSSITSSSSTPIVQDSAGGNELPITSSNPLDPSIEESSSTTPDNKVIADIMEMASALAKKWSELPVENYRIPRIERRETESLLHGSAHTGSSLLSLGAGYNDESHTFGQCWTGGNYSRQSLRKSNSQVKINRESVPVFQDASLTKAERRRLFEAQVFAAESRQQSQNVKTESSPEPATVTTNNATNPTNLKQLIILSLIAQLVQEGLTGTELEAPTSDPRPESNLYHTLQRLLPESCSDLSIDMSSLVSRVCDEVRKQTNCANSDIISLPPGWKSTTDRTGRVYYYNTRSGAVQWDQPSGPESKPNPEPSQNPCERTEEQKQFIQQVGSFIGKLLRPYLKPNCITGRITCEKDHNHLIRKFTRVYTKHIFGSAQPSNKLIFTQSLANRIQQNITRFMLSRGPVYTPRSGASKNKGSDTVLKHTGS